MIISINVIITFTITFITHISVYLFFLLYCHLQIIGRSECCLRLQFDDTRALNIHEYMGCIADLYAKKLEVLRMY